MARSIGIAPKTITPAVSQICQQLGAEHPAFIPLQPAQDARVGKCYDNCASFVQLHGGSLQYGWLLWELADVCLFAEHHCVVNVNNQIIDVTPQQSDIKSILFAPHNGEPPIITTNGIDWVPTRYLPLDDHWIPKRICELHEIHDQPPHCLLPSHVATEVDSLILAYTAWLKIVQQFECFEDSLDDFFDMAVVSGGCHIMVESVACREPFFLVISGRSQEGNPLTLVQHLSQVNFTLSGVRRANAETPRRRINIDRLPSPTVA